MYKTFTQVIQLIFKIIVLSRKKLIPSKKPSLNTLENSYYLWEARKLGISAEVILDKVVQLRKDDQVYNLVNCGTDLDGWGSMHIAADKVYCYSVLKKLSIPVPRHAVLHRGDYKGALLFQKQINSPIVIKPARGTADTTGVFVKPQGFMELFFAVNFAGSFGKEILVEEFIEGLNYRLLFCKGKFLAASLRMPASLTGDGLKTVKELISGANRNRRKVGDIPAYDPISRPMLYQISITKQLEQSIRERGLQLNSVPLKGAVIQLHDVCHWLFGGEYHDVTDEISPVLVDKCQKAVHALGIKLAGVDVISRDIRETAQGNYVVNEVNTTPAMLIHYEVQNQDKMRPVVNSILRAMFSMPAAKAAR